MSLIFATQLTAMATAVLAVFAIVTAWYARRAFLKQSQEVRAIEKQVTDQEALTRQQAELLKLQSGQLDLQREQLDDRRKANALQAEELRESLAERARQRRLAEREQANAVEFAWWPSSHVLITGSAGGNANVQGAAVLVVRNASRRRIINVTCWAATSGRPGLTLPAEKTGQLTETGSQAHRAMLNGPTEGSTVPLIRPGSRYGFLLRFDLDKQPRTHLAVHFTDDAGLHWQIDQDLHLEPLPAATAPRDRYVKETF